MKKTLLYLICILMFGFSMNAQNEWHEITSTVPVSFKPKLINSNITETTIQFDIEGFYFQESIAPVPQSKTVFIHKSSQIMEAGAPDLPKLTASIIIPDENSVIYEIISATYTDITNIDIAPSKGNLYRHTDPNDIPFFYGNTYQQNAWYPNKLVSISEPYIARDLRGVAVQVYPFQYNPVKKILRVYHSVIVKVFETEDASAVNTVNTNSTVLVEEFNQLYRHHFLNFSTDKYTPLKERGRILIISHDPYAPYMQPYINWKNQIGFPTELVQVSTIGTTPAQIKAFVQNYYNTHTDFAFLLLVGDHQHINAFPNSTPGITGPSDANYGFLAGNDHYPDIYVGRFSAESIQDVQTQVQRTIEYERAEGFEQGWLNHGAGIARWEGAGIGHNGEADCQHMDLIRNKLLNYTYDNVYQEYDNPGSSTACNVPVTTAGQLSQRFNNGVGIINYCNHGSETGWSVANYSNTHVNALTNVKRLPFIYAVACVNGAFDRTQGPCFAEAWIRATHNGQPTGAVATYMSTINQSWTPPMDAHDEMNEVLTEMHTNNIKRTFSGIAISGAMKMNDMNGAAGFEMTDTWTIFGDPSIMIRTDNPKLMFVEHEESIQLNDSDFIVYCNVEDAFVTLTKNYQIIGTGIILNGSCQIELPELDIEDTVLVTITAFNYVPYEQFVPVENVSLSIDLQAFSIIEPQQFYACSYVPIVPKFVVRNTGIDTIKSFQLSYQINSEPIVNMQWEGMLPSLGRDTITLSAYSFSEGKHTVRFFISEPNQTTDLNNQNDTLQRSFLVENLPIIVAFTSSATNYCSVPATISFQNQTQNASLYTWHFGDGTISHELNPTHTYNEQGQYNVMLIADADICGKDTLTVEGFIIGIEQPEVEHATHCGPASVTLEVEALGEVFWYNSTDNQNVIYHGNSFTTPLLDETTTYYVEASVVESLYGGRADNSTGGGGYFNSSVRHGLVFNSNEPVILKSVKVYANTAGNRTIRLENSAGTILQSKSVSIPQGESRVILDFEVPAGTDLKLTGPLSPNLWRNGSNSGGNLGYPFHIGSYLTITKSTATGYELQYYYYFYDWEIEHSCKSALTPVHVFIQSIPQANFSFTMDNNTVAFQNLSGEGMGAEYLWDFGDGTYSTEEHPVHTYTSTGNYIVTFTVINSCGEDNSTETVSVITGNINEKNVNSVSLFPVPASNFVSIQSSEPIQSIEVYQTDGRVIYSEIVWKDTHTIDVSALQGIYYVKIVTNTNTIIKPLLIIK